MPASGSAEMRAVGKGGGEGEATELGASVRKLVREAETKGFASAAEACGQVRERTRRRPALFARRAHRTTTRNLSSPAEIPRSSPRAPRTSLAN